MSTRRQSASTSLVILWLLSVVLATGCGLRDLRPDQAREGVTQAQRERGEQLIARLAEAHGGLETFRAHRSAAYVIEDTCETCRGGRSRAQIARPRASRS
jgi:hypothetical protein